MLVSQAADEYCCAITDLSPHTQRWYREKLAVFVEWSMGQQLLLEDVEQADIRRFTEVVRKRINPHTRKPISSFTVHGYIQVVKSFLNFCTKEEGLEELVSEKLPRTIRMPRREQKIIDTFTSEQIRRLFSACEKEFIQSLVVRDKAILSILLDTGIRAGELTGLTLDNVHLRSKNPYIKVFGKGLKWREVGLGNQSIFALREYITHHRHAPTEETHVFLGRISRPLTINGLDQIIERLGDWAGIKGVRCSPHTLRHTFAVNYLMAGGDIYRLSILMGHTSVKVTEIYLKTVNARMARMSGISVLDIHNKREDE